MSRKSSPKKLDALILAAGKGTRMYSKLPKVLHPIWERPMLGHVLDTLASLGIKSPCAVVGYQAASVRAFLGKSARTILQNPQKGTGHAVMVAEKALSRADEVLIWPGDMPLLKKETLRAFFSEHRKSKKSASVLTCRQANPFGYGRVVRDSYGEFVAIREELDASETERKINEVNTGIYLFNREDLFSSLKDVQPHNQKGEYYLTDTIEILRARGEGVQACCLASSEEAVGVNSKRDLAVAARFLTDRAIDGHLRAGVNVLSPNDTWIAPGVKIGAGTTVYPWCWIEAGTVIGKNCQIGPFAKIRGGSKVGDDSVVGNFVELNRSSLGKKVNAKHLTYLGDAVVGDGVNFGAGAITANFDGKKKHKTQVRGGAAIGANTVLVAPVVVPQKVKTGAGSVVTKKTRMRVGDTVVGVPARAIK
ncbi:MAG TPA: NTP transferase domain-containing protein [Candidatus Omnitrophota bacterium]|nr:NTP transferase domain-containing protein [Candidatus Omnitrophota bacterium]